MNKCWAIRQRATRRCNACTGNCAFMGAKEFIAEHKKISDAEKEIEVIRDLMANTGCPCGDSECYCTATCECEGHEGENE